MHKRLLTIDDEESIQIVIKFGINMVAGWEVLSASGGRMGIDTAQRELPDAILLDVMMPEMDGLAFLRQLRSNPHTRLIPVVLLTANRYLPDKDLLTELGVVEVISKPFLPVNLVRQIDRALLN